jgi:hypothetical protein
MSPKSPYEKADKKLVPILARIKREFNRHRLRNFTGHDELNILRIKKDTVNLYRRLDRLNRKFLLEIAREVYNDIFEELGKKPDRLFDMAWLNEILETTNEVTDYIYTNEVKRKRDRFFESLLVLTYAEYSDVDVLTLYKRARDLWSRQTEQYEINVVDYASRDAYRDLGYRSLRWNTQRDRKVCAECEERDGVVYPIDDRPDSHYLCRCYLTPP